MGSQSYTSGSGNWTVPAGVTSITLLVIGGGGGGASAGMSQGGGGGGAIRRAGHVVTPGESIAYAVGAGGSAGSNGGGSSFDGLTAGGGATSGTGGTGDYAGGAGGSGSIGSVGGGGGSSGGSAAAGNNGGSSAGGTAVTGGGGGGAGGVTGVDGAASGGGGGGAYGEFDDGGAGGPGHIQIDWAVLDTIVTRARWRGTQSMWDLRQSTASQEVQLGPFIDDTDGKTAETALTVANTDIKIFKTGATTQASKNSGGGTHIAGGNYYAVLDATDTDTIGPLMITVQVAGALPVVLYCRVLDEAVYDQLYGSSAIGGLDAAGVRSAVGLGSANLDTQLSTIDTVVDSILVDTADVGAIKTQTDQLTFTTANVVDASATISGTVDANVVEINDSASAAQRLENGAMAITHGVVGTGSTTTTIVPSALDPAASALNQFKDQAVCFAADTTTAALRGHKTPILASDSGGDLSVKAMPAAPVSGDKFTIQ